MKSFIASIAAAALLAAMGSAQPRYSVIDLGTLPGGPNSSANDLSDNRLIGGNAGLPDGTQQAVFWSGPFRINIGTPGLNSGIFGVNNSGEAAVAAEIAKKDPLKENFCAYGTGLICTAMLWQRGVLTELPTLGGNNSSIGNINAKGEVVGISETATMDPACPTEPTIAGTGPQYFDYEAVIWGPKPGDIRQLKPLAGDTVGQALWISDNSQAVGASGTCANSVLPPIAIGPHSIRWDSDGTPRDLGNLGSKVINFALSINNKGQVSGVSSVNDQATPLNGVHAFLWTDADGIKDLGTLPGDVASVGSSISESGDVMGPSGDKDGNTRAFLWRDGVMNDLNDLAVNSPLFLIWATAENARGEISGFGVTEGGDVHGYIAVPINSNAHIESDSHKMSLSEDVRKQVREHLSKMRVPGLPKH
jgi:probable HAF family extracellular repeat protein